MTRLGSFATDSQQYTHPQPSFIRPVHQLWSISCWTYLMDRPKLCIQTSFQHNAKSAHTHSPTEPPALLTQFLHIWEMRDTPSNRHQDLPVPFLWPALTSAYSKAALRNCGTGSVKAQGGALAGSGEEEAHVGLGETGKGLVGAPNSALKDKPLLLLFTFTKKKDQFLLVPFSAPLQVSQPLHLAITHSHSIRKHLDNGPPTPPHPTPPHQYSTHYTPHSRAQCVHYPIDSPTSGSPQRPPGAAGCGPQPCPPRQSGPLGWA